MKRYSEYMDHIEVSDTLHQRLVELKTPQKRPTAWKKAAGLAAALALIVGAGAWGLSQSKGGWGALMDSFHPTGGWDALIDHFDPAIEVAPEIADIASEDPGHMTEPGMKTNGGYEVVHGDGKDPNTMVSYYLLPALNWADASQGMALDYSLAPPSAVHRDAALDDVLAFCGGARAMADHLLWDGLNWGGLFWFLEDGTPCAAFLHGGGNSLSFSLEVMKGGKVPSCIVLPAEYYETSQWQGVEITAVKNGGYAIVDGVELNETREVGFFCGGVGYKLTLYTDDADRANELCARFVRYAVDGGFDLDALSADGTVLDRSGYSVGEPSWEDGEIGEFVPDYDPRYEDGVPDEDSGCPYCADGTVHTHPYNPSASGEDFIEAAPAYSAGN